MSMGIAHLADDGRRESLAALSTFLHSRCQFAPSPEYLSSRSRRFQTPDVLKQVVRLVLSWNRPRRTQFHCGIDGTRHAARQYHLKVRTVLANPCCQRK